MAKQTIDIGTVANDGTGDTGRDAFDICNDNFTELYNVTATALQADGSVDSTAVQQFDEGITAGTFTNQANTTSLIGVKDAATISSVGHYRRSLNLLSEINNNAIGTQIYGASFDIKSTGSASFGAVTGLKFDMKNAGSGDHATMTGISANVGTDVGTSGGSTGPLGIYTASRQMNGGGTFAALYGYFSANLGHANITTAYGMLLQKQTTSANIGGLVLDGDDLGADIVFGAGQDVSLHYDGTNMTLEGTGIAAVASTAAVNNTIPIDINGTVYHIMLSTTA